MKFDIVQMKIAPDQRAILLFEIKIRYLAGIVFLHR